MSKQDTLEKPAQKEEASLAKPTTITEASKPVAAPAKHTAEEQKKIDNQAELDALHSCIIDQTKTFKDLGVCDELCETCTKLGYGHPTKIQSEAIPYGLKGRDVIGLAETGSGKTAAFAIPIIQCLLSNPKPFFACVMAPTRELSLQISEHFSALGAGVGLRTAVLVGGLDMMAQAAALAKKPHIVIGTPGRMADHLANTKGFSLKSVKFMVFDEADKLLNSDFEKQIDEILSAMPRERTTFLFSATMTNKVQKLQRASLHDPVKIEVSTNKYQTASTLVQNYVFIPAKYKETYLVYLLKEYTGNSTIVFINTIQNSVRIMLTLKALGFKAVVINGKLTQAHRLAALNKFKSGEKTILIATDLANRGLDINDVDVVINYDLPEHAKDYIHRVGRTARAGKSGRAISFVTQYDVEKLQMVEYLIGKKMDLYQTSEEAALTLHERVLEAQRIAGNEMKTEKKRRKYKLTDKSGEGGEEEGDAADVRVSLDGNKRHPLNRSFARQKRPNKKHKGGD